LSVDYGKQNEKHQIFLKSIFTFYLIFVQRLIHSKAAILACNGWVPNSVTDETTGDNDIVLSAGGIAEVEHFIEITMRHVMTTASPHCQIINPLFMRS
jgi:hypothetical protein